MMRRIATLCSLATLGVLGGCASFSGMPKPVIDVATVAKIPADYSIAAILKTSNDENDSTKRRAIRNRTVAVYMAAIDARYHEFRRSISKSMKGANFGLDALSLGASGGGAIAKGAANELSALAAFLTGTRTSLSKEIYFERTLPALFTAMETSRLRKRGEILRRLREEDTVQYPLEQAFADLADYQMAASIDGAIEQVTTAAGQAAAAEVQKYENAVESCGPTKEVGGYWGRLNDFVYDLAEGAAATPPNADMAADLAQVAALMKVDPPAANMPAPTPEAQAAAIMLKAAQVCSIPALTGLIDQISTKTERRVP